MAITLGDLTKLSPQKKALILMLLFFVLGYFYYFFFFQSLYEEKSRLDAKLSALKQQMEAKQLLIKEIEKSKKDLVVLRENLQLALTQLPDRKEIPGLLSSLAKVGRSTGLDFVQFEPLPPPPTQDASKPASKPAATAPSPEAEKFYQEIPIKVILSGGFHDTVGFLEQVAKLPRIVNVTDITMEGDKEGKEEGRLTSTCMMKTYVFVEKSDAKKR